MATVSLAECKANPDRYQQLPNGVWQDRESGQFCNADENKDMITPTTSLRMVEAKHKLWEDNFNAGIAKDHAGRQELAIQAVGANLFKIATTTEAMPAVKAAAEVARLGGWIERKSGGGVTVNILNVVEGAGAADLLREVRDIDVVDME